MNALLPLSCLGLANCPSPGALQIKSYFVHCATRISPICPFPFLAPCPSLDLHSLWYLNCCHSCLASLSLNGPLSVQSISQATQPDSFPQSTAWICHFFVYKVSKHCMAPVAHRTRSKAPSLDSRPPQAGPHPSAPNVSQPHEFYDSAIHGVPETDPGLLVSPLSLMLLSLSRILFSIFA